eukprot:scaffold1061_cov116-Skeletonema_menzelii.AAC.2
MIAVVNSCEIGIHACGRTDYQEVVDVVVDDDGCQMQTRAYWEAELIMGILMRGIGRHASES